MTLLEFASNDTLTRLLVKERVKCRRRNRCDKKNHLDRKGNINDLINRKKLSRMMPARRTWMRPKKSKRNQLKLSNDAVDTSKIAEKSLLMTIKRDRKLQATGKKRFPYLEEMNAYFDSIRAQLTSGELKFDSPILKPIFKSAKRMQNGSLDVVCRPLSTYQKLDDKIIIALTSRYLARQLNRYLHPSILSYRPARPFGDKARHTTDFNDAINLIQEFRQRHGDATIYVADCDIKKFYDCFEHSMVLNCFNRILDKTKITDEGRKQVMDVIRAYLNSYDFYTNVLEESQKKPNVFHKLHRKFHDTNRQNSYRLEWPDEILAMSLEQQRQRGVPQGGALSLIVANVVLNDVDQVIVEHDDDNRLFIRYCDDMILMHTNHDECDRLINAYAESLTNHGLFYHKFQPVDKSECPPQSTTPGFWADKSHQTFLWGDGTGQANRYIGFLGYEMQRNGNMRLRKSNIKRIRKKIDRLVFALRRYDRMNIHNANAIEEHRSKTFTTLLKGIKFYSAFDFNRFKAGKQYQYLERMCQQAEARLKHQQQLYAQLLINREPAIFEPLSPQLTGLPCEVRVDTDKIYHKHHLPWLYVQACGQMIPVTIKGTPTPLLLSGSINFDFTNVYKFIKVNRSNLSQLAKGQINLNTFSQRLNKV